MSKMRVIKVEKVVVNIGVGDAGDRLQKAKQVMKMLTNNEPVETISKTTNKDLGIRKMMPIGCKTTLRGKGATEFIKKAFWVNQNRIQAYSFDPEGNFSFGIRDYTDFEGMRYDPDIGIFGIDVCVTLARPGKRVAKRTTRSAKIPQSHRITKDEGMNFVKNFFKVEVI